MVAITSWKGSWCASSVTAGYSSFRRSTVCRARCFAPRGGGGVIHDFFDLARVLARVFSGSLAGSLGAKQLARGGGHLLAFGPAGKSRRRRLHHHPKSLRAFWLELRNDGRHLCLHVLVGHRRGQVGLQDGQLGFLAAGGVCAAGLAVDVDGLFTLLRLPTHGAHDKLVVDPAAGPTLLARLHQFALQQGEGVESDIVPSLARFDEFRLDTVIKRHGGDCHTWTDRR